MPEARSYMSRKRRDRTPFNNSDKWCVQPGACKRSGLGVGLCHPCHVRRRWAAGVAFPISKFVPDGTLHAEIGRGVLRLNGAGDGTEVVVFRALEDKKIVVRPAAEIEGLFEPFVVRPANKPVEAPM
jgi:hypothetical protein